MKKIFVTICAVGFLLTGCGNEPAPSAEQKPAQVDTTPTPKPKVDMPLTLPPPTVAEKPSVEQKPSAEQKPSNKFEFRAEDLVIPETTILPPIPYNIPQPSPTEIPAPQNYTPHSPAPPPMAKRDSNISLDDFRQKFPPAAVDFGAPEIKIDNFAADYHEGENVFHGALSANVNMEIAFNKETNMVRSVWFSGNLTDKNDEELATIAFIKTVKTFKPETTETQAQELLKNLSNTMKPYEVNSTKILRSDINRDGMHYMVSISANGNFLWAVGLQ